MEFARLRLEEEAALAIAHRERLEKIISVLQQELATKQKEAQAAKVRVVNAY